MFEKLLSTVPLATVAAGAEQPNPLLSFAPLLLVFGVFYFLIIRPQQKRQKDLDKQISELKKGDKIVTAGGVIGTVTSIQNDYVVIKVGDNENTKMEILKSAVTGLRA